MQYLLSEKELKDLQNRVPTESAGKMRSAIKLMRDALLQAKGETCIHDTPRGQYVGYCDDCPLSSIGGSRVERVTDDYSTSKIICDLPRQYSK